MAGVYDTIKSIPGINEHVKIDLKMSLKNALLLTGDSEAFDNYSPARTAMIFSKSLPKDLNRNAH